MARCAGTTCVRARVPEPLTAGCRAAASSSRPRSTTSYVFMTANGVQHVNSRTFSRRAANAPLRRAMTSTCPPSMCGTVHCHSHPALRQSSTSARGAAEPAASAAASPTSPTSDRPGTATAQVVLSPRCCVRIQQARSDTRRPTHAAEAQRLVPPPAQPLKSSNQEPAGEQSARGT